MKRTAHICGLCIVLIGYAYGLQARSRYDPAKQKSAENRPKGFVDFTLHRLNPTDKDYGECIEESRVLVLQETIKTGYFWSNAVSLCLAVCLLGVVVYQHRQQIDRGWQMAIVLQQFEHALSRANAQVDEGVARNRELMDAFTSMHEGQPSSVPAMPELRECNPSPDAEARKNASAKSTDVETSNALLLGLKAKTAVPNSGNQMGLFKPDVDLLLKVNSLEQQLKLSQSQEKQLRKQLTQTDQRLQVEQSKNQTLKGA